MDETMGDDTKDPGPFQQRSDPAAEPEGALAQSMDESMDGDLAAAAPNTKLKNKSQRQTKRGLRNTESTKKRNANKMNKRRARQATEVGGTPTENPPGKYGLSCSINIIINFKTAADWLDKRRGNVRPETMDEAMDDGTKDPGPFQQRNDPATKPKDAVAESMDESKDGDSRPQPAGYYSRAPFPDRPFTNASATRHELPQPQQTKAQKKNQRRARKLQG
eukprot:CAMPEP_0172647986 /NCGR_PEP_ID=MMETSP1068-20121228/241036_1 /TAXON_ID=35684 /ORGANISM="Pseudopedinella elastica, Strain CCMP716" /LENGTH=219 /DNA_ID=CAMNT_0013462285 /DNA_START=470 /DNA_END=1129 /DNA_ORIENTATION=+